jgi:hypothetical protein
MVRASWRATLQFLIRQLVSAEIGERPLLNLLVLFRKRPWFVCRFTRSRIRKAW